MKAIHMVCHKNGSAPEGLKEVDGDAGVFQSSWWKMSVEDANSLVGGWLYLHDSSTKPSYFHGKIRELGPTHEDGAVSFVFKKVDEPLKFKWRGKLAGRARSQHFRIVEADYAHEG